MASRIMHLAAAKIIAQRLDIKDSARYTIGQLLPDAVMRADKAQANTHYVTDIDGKMRTMDFLRFGREFSQKLLCDELYLGYYFHLFQDCLFRRGIYYDLGFVEKRRQPGFCERLYTDYHIVNAYVIQKYGLDSGISVPVGFEDEEINRIYRFDLDLFIEAVKSDFNDTATGECVYFTPENADMFIGLAANECEKEYERLLHGGHFPDTDKITWEIADR